MAKIAKRINAGTKTRLINKYGSQYATVSIPEGLTLRELFAGGLVQHIAELNDNGSIVKVHLIHKIIDSIERPLTYDRKGYELT